MFDNGSEFKWENFNFLNDFSIKPVLTKINNSQANAPVERVNQVILNMFVTKELDNKVFNHMYTDK